MPQNGSGMLILGQVHGHIGHGPASGHASEKELGHFAAVPIAVGVRPKYALDTCPIHPLEAAPARAAVRIARDGWDGYRW